MFECLADFNQKWSLVWLGMKGWEEDFIPNQLLKGLPIGRVLDHFWPHYKNGNNLENSIVSTINNYTVVVMRSSSPTVVQKNKMYIQKAIERRVTILVVIFLNEQNSYDDCNLPCKNAPLFINNYYVKSCAERHKNYIFAPLRSVSKHGYFENNLEVTSTVFNRSFAWSFSSAHKSDIRNQFIKHMETMAVSHPGISYSCSYPKESNEKTFIHLLNDSIFSISPEGNVAETWRFYESMECGAIPVINRTTLIHYYQYALPCNITTLLIAEEYPLPIILSLLEDKVKLEERRRQLIGTYSTWRDDMQSTLVKRIRTLGSGHLTPSPEHFWDYESCFIQEAVPLARNSLPPYYLYAKCLFTHFHIIIFMSTFALPFSFFSGSYQSPKCKSTQTMFKKATLLGQPTDAGTFLDGLDWTIVKATLRFLIQRLFMDFLKKYIKPVSNLRFLLPMKILMAS
eukprot:gene7207-14697_t